MPVTIRPLHPVFAGEVAGVDCRRPLDSDAVAAIEAGMDEYAVLVFRDQNLTDDEQIAFTRHFGELEHHTRRAMSASARTIGSVPALPISLTSTKRRDHVAGGPGVVFQTRRPAVAFGQLVPPDPGQVFAAVRAGFAILGRQHRIRRHARRL